MQGRHNFWGLIQVETLNKPLKKKYVAVFILHFPESVKEFKDCSDERDFLM